MRDNLSAGLLPAKAWPLEVKPQSFEHPGESRREESRVMKSQREKQSAEVRLMNLLNANYTAGFVCFFCFFHFYSVFFFFFLAPQLYQGSTNPAAQLRAQAQTPHRITGGGGGGDGGGGRGGGVLFIGLLLVEKGSEDWLERTQAHTHAAAHANLSRRK